MIISTKNLSTDLHNQRIRSGLTLEALSEKAGVNIRTITRIQSGQTTSTVRILAKIFRVLADSIAETTGDDSEAEIVLVFDGEEEAGKEIEK
jgi:transcriptional regulator with XRE-family HTH domain